MIILLKIILDTLSTFENVELKLRNRHSKILFVIFSLENEISGLDPTLDCYEICWHVC